MAKAKPQLIPEWKQTPPNNNVSVHPLLTTLTTTTSRTSMSDKSYANVDTSNYPFQMLHLMWLIKGSLKPIIHVLIKSQESVEARTREVSGISVSRTVRDLFPLAPYFGLIVVSYYAY